MRLLYLVLHVCYLIRASCFAEGGVDTSDGGGTGDSTSQESKSY